MGTVVDTDSPPNTMSAEIAEEIGPLQAELREIQVLIRQTGGEVERLLQKQGDISVRLRQVENNFDSYSREDIKQAYAAERDAQLKLVMMRSQLEQFQSKQRYLDRYIQQLRHLDEMKMQYASHSGAGSDSGDGARMDHQAVIQTIEAQEAERQRLAQQMHDGPAQSLTNLILQAEIVERLYSSNPDRARTELSNLKASAHATFQRVRDFIFGLRPMMLDDLGLVPTLRRYGQTFESKHKVALSLNVNGDRTLPPYVEVTIFRVVQELLTNVGLHSNAANAQVKVDLNAEPVTIEVHDDGSGFDVNEALAKVRGRGASGLVTVEKRVEMLGGNISYDSEGGKGTTVRVAIPSS